MQEFVQQAMSLELMPEKRILIKKNISSSFLYVCACYYDREWAHL